MKKETVKAQGMEVSVDWAESLEEMLSRYNCTEKDCIEMAMSYVVVRGVQAAIKRSRTHDPNEAQKIADTYKPGERKAMGSSQKKLLKAIKSVPADKLSAFLKKFNIDLSTIE